MHGPIWFLDHDAWSSIWIEVNDGKLSAYEVDDDMPSIPRAIIGAARSELVLDQETSVFMGRAEVDPPTNFGFVLSRRHLKLYFTAHSKKDLVGWKRVIFEEISNAPKTENNLDLIEELVKEEFVQNESVKEESVKSEPRVLGGMTIAKEVDVVEAESEAASNEEAIVSKTSSTTESSVLAEDELTGHKLTLPEKQLKKEEHAAPVKHSTPLVMPIDYGGEISHILIRFGADLQVVPLNETDNLDEVSVLDLKVLICIHLNSLLRQDHIIYPNEIDLKLGKTPLREYWTASACGVFPGCELEVVRRKTHLTASAERSKEFPAMALNIKVDSRSMCLEMYEDQDPEAVIEEFLQTAHISPEDSIPIISKSYLTLALNYQNRKSRLFKVIVF